MKNILLFAFSSQQIVSLFPQLFESGKDILYGNTDLSDYFGGAATGLFAAMVDLGVNGTNLNSTGWDLPGFDILPTTYGEENLSEMV